MEQSESDLIAAVRELARGKFAARAREHDLEGTFVAENIGELRALRIPAMGLGADLGGLGVTPETHIRVVEEVAYGDGSTAVALNMHLFAAEALLGLPPFPRRDAVLQDVGKNAALLCGPVSIPSGELDNRASGLRAIEDGDVLKVNGRVGFASMSEGAKYVMAVGTVARGEGAEPDIAMMMPAIDSPGIRILGNWDAMGFRATASHDLAFEDVSVPKGEALVAPMAMIRVIIEAAAANPVLAQQRARGALGICAIWLGLAQAAFDFTVDYVGKRHGLAAGDTTLFGQVGYRGAEPWAQVGIGEMDHWLETGRIVLYDMVRRLGTPFASTQEFNRAMVRVVYHLRRMSEEVSAGAMRVCGAHAYVRSRPLERIFRDMVGCNVMAWKTDQLRQTLGMAALGMPIAIGGPSPT
ncbi:MAG: acyl-CoA/acyl-ACP dehydrogenase [Chloroflexi bacterium]|nr:acyl-CoA/acyl-ACP dehydrogenase [Chloroflexota bacterium]